MNSPCSSFASAQTITFVYDELGRLVGVIDTQSATRRVTLDIDSSEGPVHGVQEQSAYNGRFESVCYHPPLRLQPGR